MPYLERDGVALYWERAGAGGRPVLLVHGWCCDRTYLAPQVRHLADGGFDVISVDLRGHGLSDKPEQRYDIADFTDDVAWLIGALDLERPVVIGHSMGGIIAYDLGCRYPGLASALVMIDAAIVRPPSGHSAMSSVLEKLRGPDYRNALRELVVATLFIPTDDADRRERILEAMVATPRHVITAAYAGLAGFEPVAMPAEPATPSLYIAADEPVPRSDIARLRELAPALQVGQTVGSGHFCQLEVPEQVNAMIDRFLLLNRAAGVGAAP